jgi:hypothetical protein
VRCVTIKLGDIYHCLRLRCIDVRLQLKRVLNRLAGADLLGLGLLIAAADPTLPEIVSDASTPR